MAQLIAGLLLVSLYAAAAPGEAAAALHFEDVLERAVSRATAEDARLEVTKSNLKLLEALGKTRIELRPSLGLLAFSNPVLLAANVGAGLLLNRRMAPSAAVLESARFDALASEIQVQGTRIEARTAAARAYFQLLEKQEMGVRAGQSLAEQRKRRAEIDGLLRQARITAFDQVGFEQQLVELEWQTMEAEAERKAAAARLALLIGWSGEPASLRVEEVELDRGSWRQPAPPLTELLANAGRNRGEVRVMRAKIESLERQAPGGRRVQFESLDGGYSYVNNLPGVASTVAGFLLGGNTGRGELNLRIPLTDGGEKGARNALLAARIRLLETELRNIEDSIRGEIMTLDAAAAADLDRVRLTERKLELAEKAYQAVEARVEAQLAQASALVQAAHGVVAARWDHIRAVNERKASLFTLNLVAGLDLGPAGARSGGGVGEAAAKGLDGSR